MVVLQRARRRTVRRFPALAPLLWVVRETGEGRVLGFGTATFHHDPARLLVVRTGLFVAPEVRRRGVGRLLKQTLLLESAKLGARRAEAILVASNEPSRELNRSLGYELRATEFHDRRAPDVELHIAERALDPPGGAPPVAVVRRPGSDGASAGTPARS
jgi:L-amino acid N-acyltransferase YncA